MIVLDSGTKSFSVFCVIIFALLAYLIVLIYGKSDEEVFFDQHVFQAYEEDFERLKILGVSLSGCDTTDPACTTTLEVEVDGQVYFRSYTPSMSLRMFDINAGISSISMIDLWGRE